MCVHFAGAKEKCTFSKQNKPTINRHSTDKEVNHKVTHLHRNQLTKVMKQQLIGLQGNFLPEPHLVFKILYKKMSQSKKYFYKLGCRKLALFQLSSLPALTGLGGNHSENYFFFSLNYSGLLRIVLIVDNVSTFAGM